MGILRILDVCPVLLEDKQHLRFAGKATLEILTEVFNGYTNFRLEPLPIEKFKPYFKLTDEELQHLSANWIDVDMDPGFPCRVSLTDAEVGERVLAMTYIHHDVGTPYKAFGALFVREFAETANLAVNEIPNMFRQRLLSVRAYDSGSMMIDAQVIQGADLKQIIVNLFENCDVEYLHIHKANPGCFNCTVRRV